MTGYCFRAALARFWLLFWVWLYPAAASYLTPGKDIVWTSEGNDVGNVAFDAISSPDDGTPGACAAACDTTAGCNGFSKCHSPAKCWLKDKAICAEDVPSEPTRSFPGCTSFYTPSTVGCAPPAPSTTTITTTTSSFTSTSASTSSTSASSSTVSTATSTSHTSSTSMSTSSTSISSTSTSSTSTWTRTRVSNITHAVLALESQATEFQNILLAQNSSEATFILPDGSAVLAATWQPDAGDVVLTIETASVSIAQELDAGSAAITSMDASTDLYHLLNSSLDGSGSSLASALISIILHDIDGNPVEGILPTPLTFNLTVGNASSEPGVTCKFWDDEMNIWSSRGVEMLSAADGVITCSTTHLSIFAIIIDTIISTLVCSNAASIFSLEGLQSLQSVEWATRPASVMNWFILVMGAFLLSLATCADRRTRGNLKELQTTLDVCDRFEKIKRGEDRADFWSQIFDLNFASLCSCDVARSAGSRVVRRRTGVSLKVLNRMHADAGSVASHDLAQSALQSFWQMNCCSKLLLLYRTNCAYCSVLEPRTNSTCLQRTSLLIARLYSGWAVAAVFYSSTSIAPGQPDCEPRVSLLEIVVQSALIAFITAAVGALPLVALLALKRWAALGPLRMRLAFFWTFLAAYFLLCLMVVCIFIATVSPPDSAKWMVSGITNVLTSALFTPLLISSVTACWLSVRRLDRLVTKVASQWRSEPLQALVHVEHVSLSDEALKTVAQSTRITITCQVAGHDEQTELQEDDGQVYRSLVPYQLEAHQLLIFSAYIAREGRSNLTASAFLHASQLQDGCFKGSLPLILEGKKLHAGLHVTVTAGKEGHEGKRDAEVALEVQELLEAPAVLLASPELQKMVHMEPVEASEASEEESEASECDVPRELDAPIVLMSMVAPELEEPTDSEVPRELSSIPMVQDPKGRGASDGRKEGPTQASSRKPEPQMAQGEREMEAPPMEAPPIMEAVWMEEPPERSEEAGRVSPRQEASHPKPSHMAPTSPGASPSTPGASTTGSRRQELAETTAEPDLADLIKAAESRFQAKTSSPLKFSSLNQRT